MITQLLTTLYGHILANDMNKDCEVRNQASTLLLTLLTTKTQFYLKGPVIIYQGCQVEYEGGTENCIGLKAGSELF